MSTTRALRGPLAGAVLSLDGDRRQRAGCLGSLEAAGHAAHLMGPETESQAGGLFPEPMATVEPEASRTLSCDVPLSAQLGASQGPLFPGEDVRGQGSCFQTL